MSSPASLFRGAFAAAALTLSACSDPAAPSVLTAITVSPKTLTIWQGDTVRFTATQIFSGATPPAPEKVTWLAIDSRYFVIDTNGVGIAVSGIQAGDRTVSVVASAGSKSDAATITISGFSLELFPDTNALLIGMTRQLQPIKTTYGNPYRIFTTLAATSWTSRDPGVATVDGTGVVTALAAGRTTIQSNLLIDGRPDSVTATVEVVTPPGRQYSVASGGIFQTQDASQKLVARSCALGTADRRLYCWGESMPTDARPYDRCKYFQTAAGTSALVRVHCATFPALMMDTVTFTALSVGYFGGCAIPTTTGIYCWGMNDGGSLGSGTLDGYPIDAWTEHNPVKILATDQFRSIYASGTILASTVPVCAIRIDGAAFCWGGGSTAARRLGAQTWITLAEQPSCGIASDSTAYCWSSATLAPQQVSPSLRLTGVVVTDLGVDCGLTVTGGMMCWGFDASGVPLAPTTVDGPAFVSVGPIAIQRSDIAPARLRPCGLTAGGDLYCVVKSSSGTLSLQPLNLGVQLKRFSGGCGIGIDDKAYCWNARGGGVVLVPGQ